MTAAWRGGVEIDARARRAWPFLTARAPVGSIWVSEVGVAVRVLQDGTAEPVAVFGAKSAASDPCAGRRPHPVIPVLAPDCG